MYKNKVDELASECMSINIAGLLAQADVDVAMRLADIHAAPQAESQKTQEKIQKLLATQTMPKFDESAMPTYPSTATAKLTLQYQLQSIETLKAETSLSIEYNNSVRQMM